jgi:hypothetical protein
VPAIAEHALRVGAGGVAQVRADGGDAGFAGEGGGVGGRRDNSLLHGEQSIAFTDSVCREATSGPTRSPARAGKSCGGRARASASRTGKLGQSVDEIEHLKASVRAKVEPAFRVIKRQFGHTKVRYRVPAKNTAQLHTLFAPTNLWVVLNELLARDGNMRPLRASRADYSMMGTDMNTILPTSCIW